MTGHSRISAALWAEPSSLWRMTKISGRMAFSVFSVSSRRGYFLPILNIHYQEVDGPQWTVAAGGTRVYVVRFGNPLKDDPEEQSADSHFMIRRLTSSLLLGGLGLFQSETSGRLFIRNVHGDISWTSYFDWPAPSDQPTAAAAQRVNDWFAAISKHTILRRAADDAHLALSNPHEALVFTYRGLEWLVVGRWESGAIGVDLYSRTFNRHIDVLFTQRRVSRAELFVDQRP